MSRGRRGSSRYPSRMRLGIELLGGVRATVDGVALQIAGRLPQAMLAALTLADGHVVSADRLIDFVWDDDPPRTARRTLQSYVAALRRVLGGDTGPLSASGAGYILAVDRPNVDLFDFADSVARAKAASARDPAQAAVDLSWALRSWKQPLDGLRPSLSLQAMVAPYEELRLEALEALNDVELDFGDAGRAVGRLETLVREHPVRERFWAQLACGLAKLGRRDAALQACQRARESLRHQLGVNPSPLLQRLERHILDGVPTPHPANTAPERAATTTVTADVPGISRVSLPRPMTSLLGRDAELDQLVPVVKARVRLMTFTGVGGVGKTRLATEVAWRCVDEFPGGVRFVDLAAVSGEGAVASAVASTLSVPAQPEMSVAQSIVDWCRGRRALLMLDNCEHVLDAVVALVDAIVSACPRIVILTTSREPLGLPGEQLHLVTTLDPTGAALELLCARARDADTSFEPTSADLDVLVRICACLDGIPLALELAASRLHAFTPTDLLDHLLDRSALLGRSVRAVPERHQTMRATVRWSYDLIDDDERELFDRLSVFAGDFDLAAAQAVCAGAGLTQDDVVVLLGALVERSMVVADRRGRRARYRVLEILRQFGAQRLEERAATAGMQDRHCAHYLEVGRRAGERWASSLQPEGAAVFEQEWDNFRAAHRWGVSTGDPADAEALIVATGPHAWSRLLHEHGEWANHVIARREPGRGAAAMVFGWAAYWAFIGGDYERSSTLSREGIAAAPGPVHPDTAWCWAGLVWAELAAGRKESAWLPAQQAGAAFAAGDSEVFVESAVRIAAIEESVATNLAAAARYVRGYASWAAEVGAPSLRSRAAFYDGMILQTRHRDHAGALECFRAGIELARSVGDVNNEGKNLAGATVAVTRLGIPGTTRTACRDALVRLYDTRHWPMLWVAVENIARWMVSTDDLEPAAVIYGHLTLNQPTWDAGSGARNRTRGIDLVRAAERGPEGMDRGAAMDRNDLVSFIIDRLDSVR